MAGRPKSELRGLQEKTHSLLGEGQSAEEVAEAVGVSARTVRRWRRSRADGEHRGDGADVRKGEMQALAEMLSAECPAVARVMLDLAKGGDVRAAALVVKWQGNTLGAPEELDDADSEAALSEIERELNALPSAIASEIVGLLAQADSEAAGRDSGRRAGPGGRERRHLRLPWQTENRPSDEGEDSV